MAPPPSSVPEPQAPPSTLGNLLRLSGAGIIVSAGISLAWPFRTSALRADRASEVSQLSKVERPTLPAEAVQTVFQAPEQLTPSVKVVRSPKRPPIQSKNARATAAPPPETLPPVELAAEPPELASQFTALERVDSSARSARSRTPDRPLREHRLVDGDTLQRLAQRYLGDAQRWQEIQSLNASVLRDPAVLPIGKTVRIPGDREASRTTTIDTPVHNTRQQATAVSEPRPSR